MSDDTKRNLDRREFILAAGAAAAVAYVPFAAVAAVAAAPAVGAAAPVAALADWTIDDMWGVYPRPHEAIGYAPPREDGELRAALDPVIAGLMA